MKALLQKWNGEFEIDNKVYDNIDEIELKDGENFHIILLGGRNDRNRGNSVKEPIRNN